MKTTRPLFVCLFLLSNPFNVFCQSHFKVGFAIIPQATALEEKVFEHTPVMRLALGPLFVYAPTDRIQIESGMIYSAQGQRNGGRDGMPERWETPSLSLIYIKFPFLLSWKITRLKSFRLGLNGGASYCLLGNAVRQPSVGKGATRYGPQYSHTDVSLRLGPKAWYQLTPRAAFAMCLFFERGTMALEDHEVVDFYKVYNQVYGLSFEVMYAAK